MAHSLCGWWFLEDGVDDGTVVDRDRFVWPCFIKSIRQMPNHASALAGLQRLHSLAHVNVLDELRHCRN
jgi:hypothetical protein